MRFLQRQFWIVLALLILLGCGSKSDPPSTSAGPVISITVTPSTGAINTSSSVTQQFKAVAYDVNGQTVTGISFAWTDSGAFSCIGQTGLATATSSPGTDSITASYGSVSGNASLQISGPPPPPYICK